MKSCKLRITLQHGILNWWEHFGVDIEEGKLMWARLCLQKCGDDAAEDALPNFIPSKYIANSLCNDSGFLTFL